MATSQTLSIKDRTVLRALGKAGDILARAANAAIANDSNLGRASLIAGGTAVSTKAATAIHAAIAGNTSVVAVTTGITNPTYIRNLLITFQAAWDGGDVVVVGTNQFDAVISETFVSNPASTRVGLKIFKTVTSVAHTAVGATANTYSVGDGDKLGIIPVPVASSPVVLFTSGVAEAVTFDATYNGFTPTSIPNSARTYILSANV